MKSEAYDTIDTKDDIHVFNSKLYASIKEYGFDKNRKSKKNETSFIDII